MTPWSEAVVVRIERRTPRIVSVFLRTGLARHEAGQHVDVGLTAEDGYHAERSYSIASAPGAELLELLVERLEEGEVSSWFHDVAAAGDTLEVRGPLGGHFVWRREDGGPLLLVGGGSGVAPLLAMVRARNDAASEVPVLLVAAARTRGDVVYGADLEALDRTDPHFRFVVATSRETRRGPGDPGRLDGPSLRAILDAWGAAPRHVFVCGGNGFVETVASALVAAGLDPAAVRTERYGGV